MVNDDSLYLSAKLKEHFNVRVVRSTLIVISVLVMGLIVWASLSSVHEKAIAKGEIEPNGYLIKIQHLDGGILEELLVKEGDQVEKGQLLGKLKNTGIEEDLAKLGIEQLNLKMQIKRLKSMIQNEPLNAESYQGFDSAFASQQLRIYKDAIQSRESQRKVLLDQLSQQEYLSKRLLAQKSSIEKELPVAKNIYSIYENLANQGNAPNVKRLEEKRRIIDLEGQYATLLVNIKEADEKIQEFRSKIESFDATYLEKLNSELERLENQSQLTAEQINKLKRNKERLNLVTPENGIINSILVSNEGEVVNPGQTILEVVPIDKPMVANIHILPSDIGHVKVGDPVRVKISSYDYLRYGIVEGELLKISPTTLKDETGHSYYKGLVRLKKNYVGAIFNENIILPGMVVQAEITTDEKSIMAYLLKPIYLSLSNAMDER